MRFTLSLSLAVFLILAITPAAQAATAIEVNGQLRFRTEFDDRLFDDQFNMSVYHLLRTRLGIGATVDDNARFYVQFQDSRTLGAENELGKLQSGTTEDSKNVDAHQAYLKIRRLWTDGLGLKAGRFEVALGNERVFGPVGWSNVGRSWEGMIGWYRTARVRIRAMALKRRELEGPHVQSTDGTGSDTYGIVLDIVDPALQIFLAYDRDASDSLVQKTPAQAAASRAHAARAENEAADECNNMDRVTIGAFFKNAVEDMGLDYWLNAAFQTGTIHGVFGVPSPEYDISAYLINFELGYSIEGERPARLAGAIDYTSGDADTSDGDWGAYDNLYYTGHKWRGFMDYFASSNTRGLLDFIARAKVEVAPDWWFLGDLHYFKTAREYEDPLDTDTSDGVDMTSDVGVELDLTVKTKSVEGVQMMGGASVFLPKESFAGVKDPDTGLWFYYQLAVDFD